MRFKIPYFSSLRFSFGARFHAVRGSSSSLNCEFQPPSEYAAPDRRLEIFFEQQRRPWNAAKKLETSIIVTVVMPDAAGVQTSFTFDALSAPPTPAHILSLLPDSINPLLGSMDSNAEKTFAPIAAAANGRVIGLGRSACISVSISDVKF
jgi:hypothetical protein